ncbi:hypothetical protein SCHPADRAFT_696653 [Schizopora paradoxa]|uniref:Uncharacterized protein n=1 Tax=Schizopora paradoxa TaxID=27342 RepID=A0A0H2R319_9AGAM|nr:hypothetical protein SCHPADRAFT_696653 [Schizopora paradoxa]
MLWAGEIAKQAIITTLRDVSGETQAKGTFPWSFSGHNANRFTKEVDYDNLRSNLQVAGSVEDLLQRMLVSASAAVKDLKAKFSVMVNQRKFQSLSDDILSIVFEMAYQNLPDDKQKLKFVKNLFFVSRRFRSIVIGLPVLWSNISSLLLNHKDAELFASRITSSILSLSIYGGYSYNKEAEESRILGWYQFAASISSRIRTFHIHVSKNDKNALKKFDELCPIVSLPALEELTLDSSRNLTRGTMKFCCKWTVPSLRRLNIVECLPELPAESLSKIRICSLEVNKLAAKQEELWSSRNIIQFLLSLTVVKELRVNIRLPHRHSGPLPKMVSVERLTLVLQDYEVDVKMGKYLLDFILFPSITSFRLELGAKELRRLGGLLNRLQFKTPPTSVSQVTLSAGTDDKPINGNFPGFESPTHFIGEWCREFEGLKSLTLEDRQDNTFGLIPFTTPVDAVKVVGTKGDVSGGLLGKLPSLWDYYERPFRTAVIGAEDLRAKRKEKLEIVEKNE